MNRKLFMELLKHNQEKDLKIVEDKNSDYADGGDPFQNFRMVEDASLISTEEGIAVRMSDKMQRIFNLIQEEEASVSDETIVDTLSDLRNYANILQVYLEHEKGRPGSEKDLKQVSVETSDYNCDGDVLDWETCEITVDPDSFEVKGMDVGFGDVNES